MKIDIDTKKDLGIEPLTLCIDGKDVTVEAVDTFKFADRLDELFAEFRTNNTDARDAWPILRTEWKVWGFELPEDGFNLAYVASRRLIKGAFDRKKKFEASLWATGDEWPDAPDTTQESTPGASPTASS